MELKELKGAIRQTIGNDLYPDQNKLSDAMRGLEDLASALDMLGSQGADADVLAGCRALLAERALTLSQICVPKLMAISSRALEIAGERAVRIVCSDTVLDSTGADGKKMEPIPSPFVLPPEYASPVSKVRDAIKSVAVGVAAVMLGFLTR